MRAEEDSAGPGSTDDAPARRQEPRGGRLIVALGASAGGLEAFRSFLSATPSDSGLAFVLVHHLEAQQPGPTLQLLGAHAAIPILEAMDGMAIEPDHVYVVPSNVSPAIQAGRFRLSRLAEPRAARATIDALFRSLAEDQKGRAVAIVLSGSGHDGVRGLMAVREHGGLTIAQHPSTARHPETPQHAIATGLVSYVLAIPDMPAALLEHARRLTHGSDPSSLVEEDVAACLPEICALLRERTGHDFHQYKRTTLIRRVHHRAQVMHARSILDYVALLQREADEPKQLVRDLLVSVTEFFRDTDTFDVLRQAIVPALLAGRGAESHLRIWVPGCATGEEVYSIAILLLEHLGSRAVPRVQIFGTDVDEHALEIARQGRYPATVAERVSPGRFSRFFVEDAGSCCVSKALRDLCIFSRHDLTRDPPFSRLDLISCRNVLIYLEGELQRRVLGLFHYALAEDGYLLLGPSENVSQRSELFRTVDGKRRIFQKKRSVGVFVPPRIVPGDRLLAADRRGGELLRRGRWSPEQSFERTIERRLLERYGPPCVVVNEQGDIVYLSGETGKYLAPSTGALDVNVANMVLRALRPEVRSAVHRAVRAREQVVHENIQVETVAGPQRLNLVVRPLGELDDDLGLFVVLFDELRPAARGEAPPPGPTRENAALVDQLEHELKATREHLQTTIEELETSNEELKSSNEELLSMNEELQSLNEEFETLNGELKAKIDELDATNSDLQNLLLSTQIPTVFLDEDLHIRRFTPAATEVFRLIDSDVGRPISDIVARFDAASLLSDARDVLRTLAPRQREVTLEDGRCCYIVRTLPYRTMTNVISGVVITFVNVTSIKESEEQRALLAAIVDSADQAIIGKTNDGVITSWNAAAERMFGYDAKEVIGRSIFLIVPPEHEGEMRDILAMAARGERVAPMETVRIARGGRRLDVAITVAAIRDIGGRIIGTSTIANDVTPRRQAEQALRASEEDFRALFEGSAIGKVQCEPVSGRFLRVNRRFAEMLGYDTAELIGKTFADITAPEDRTSALESYERLLRGEIDDYSMEKRYLAKDGRRVWAYTTVTSTRNAAGRAVRMIAGVQDITQRKRAEAEIITAREAAEQASRAKDQFLAVLSHELRTPLTPVVTAASRLLRRDDLPDDVRRSVSMILRNAELEARLIDDLLDLTRVTRGKLELTTQVVRAQAVIAHVVEICTDEIDAKDIRLSVEVDEGDHWVTADVARMEQAVWNLLKNAVKFSAPGARIVLRCYDEGAQVIIEVEDEGVGIAPEVLPRIFEAFEQGNAATTRRFGGLGLGLAISQAVVQLHGGTITATSQGSGSGATFRVLLPAAEPPEASAPAAARSEAAQPQGALRILLVEDHEDTAEMMSELLTLSGHAVRVAGGVRAALEKAEAERFDLVLSDLGLPDGGGIALLASLRAAGHEMKAIALSGYGMEEDRQRTAAAGFLEHLVKPVSYRDLEVAIQRVMAAR